MSGFQSVVRTMAPTLATALPGPLGGIAASVAANALFGDDAAAKAAATPKSIIEAVTTSNDPAVLEKLKQAELDLRKFEAQNSFRFAQLDESSAENARQMRIAGFTANDHTRDQLSWLIMISFLVVAITILLGCVLLISGYIDLSKTNPQTLVAISGMTGVILGYFSSNAQQVVGFYFGSSAGSRAKSEQLDYAAQTAIAAIVRQQQTAVRTWPGGTTTAASGEAARDLSEKAESPAPGGATESVRQARGESAATASLLPQSMPETMPDLPSHLVKPHLHGVEVAKSSVDTSATVPRRQQRHVNAWIEDESLPLILSRLYRLGINIGDLRADAVAAHEFHEPAWSGRDSLELSILISGSGFAATPCGHSVALPRRGDTKPAYFVIRPLRSGLSVLRVSIFLAPKLTLLEEFELPIDVATAQEAA